MLVSDAGNVDDGACPSDYGTGEVPERYRVRRLVREQDGPVTVLRCHVPSGHGKSYRVRMWAFFAFTLAAASAGIVVPRPDVVIATSPPLVAGIPGWLVAKLRLHRVPWTFEIRDLWPESTVRAGVLRKDSLLTKALYVLERGACKSADRANVLTPAFREDLVGRGLATAEKVIFVPKGADVSLFKPGPRDNAVRREFAWGDRFTVMYSGAHGRANAVGQRVEAADRLRDRSDILLATVGDGSERAEAEAEAKKRGLNNTVFCTAQPKHRMPDFVQACDVGAAVLQNDPTFRTVDPNKVFDYMGCERPVLLAVDGAAREMVCEKAKAGVFAEPENPQALAAATMRLADDPEGRARMARSGRQWVLDNATPESLAERYLGVMRDLVEQQKGLETRAVESK